MTGIEAAIVGSTLASSTAGASAVGLLGAGGVFAPMAGSLATGFGAMGGLGTLGQIASLGSMFLSSRADQTQTQDAIAAERTNAAIERTNAAEREVEANRQKYLRTGANIAAAGAMGSGQTGSVLDVLADNAAQDELNIIGIRRNLTVTQDLSKSKVSAMKSSAQMKQYSGILSGVTKLIN